MEVEVMEMTEVWRVEVEMEVMEVREVVKLVPGDDERVGDGGGGGRQWRW